MRDQISIPAKNGAEIYINKGGGVSITQDRGDGEQLVILSLDEAFAVAKALDEVARSQMDKEQQT